MKDFINRRVFKDSIEDLQHSIMGNKYGVLVKRLGMDYVTDTERLQNVSKYLSCMSECLAQYFIVFAIQKNSYYKDMINKRLIGLLQSGIIGHWQTDIINKYRITYMNDFFGVNKNKNTEPFSLSLGHTKGAFLLLIAGLSLAKIIFLNEVFGLIQFHNRIKLN